MELEHNICLTTSQIKNDSEFLFFPRALLEGEQFQQEILRDHLGNSKHPTKNLLIILTL